MFRALDHPYLVPFDGSFRVASASTMPPDRVPGKRALKERLDTLADETRELQRRLYAEDRSALLCVFQALDAAGKDGTIRHVFQALNPAGCQVFSFKRPSSEELDHDFLWRTTCRLPERGRVGIFNRSYYEEVLVVRVHPAILDGQRLPDRPESIWEERFESIRDLEKHLARNGTAVLKFWLNVSKDEQRKRFLARIDESEKNWKFAEGDVRERGHWDAYMRAYEDVLGATSRPWAPWYAIPADSKPYMRLTVAEIVLATLRSLEPRYPEVTDERRAELRDMRGHLEDEG